MPDVAAIPASVVYDEPAADRVKVEVERLNLYYAGGKHALQDVSLRIGASEVTALIGPSGCGKSTLLRCFNRMNELILGTRIDGSIRIDGADIYAADADPVLVRRRVGMVFQQPNPFPKSIYQNIAWGAKINGLKGHMDERVEKALRAAALWDEVKDRLKENAYSLSGGQQQRLCIARALAVEPDVLLMDEPTSALDPRASAKVEETILHLKQQYTVIIVTHNMQQAQRVSDRTAFMFEGYLVEYGPTTHIFGNPQVQRTKDYVMGRFG